MESDWRFNVPVIGSWFSLVRYALTNTTLSGAFCLSIFNSSFPEFAEGGLVIHSHKRRKIQQQIKQKVQITFS